MIVRLPYAVFDFSFHPLLHCAKRLLGCYRLIVAALLLAMHLPVLGNVPTLTVESGQWQLITLPAASETEETLAEVIGDDLPISAYGVQWVVWTYDASSGSYAQLSPTSPLRLGSGYWLLQLTGNPVEIDLPANAEPLPLNTFQGCSSVLGCSTLEIVESTAGVSWNLLGFSISEATALSQTRVSSEQTQCEIDCSLPEAFSEDVLLDFVWVFDGDAYQAVNASESLQPWQGFWAAALPEAGNDTQWHVPAPVSVNPLPDLSKFERVFTEDFNGTDPLDPDVWQTALLWGPYRFINNEEQLYVDRHGFHPDEDYNPFSMSGEALQITATRTSSTVTAPQQPDADDDIWLEYPEARQVASYDPDDVGFLSGIITSYDAFRFTHGYVESRIKVPAGQGLWPAIWLLNSHYVENSPEIDIVEFLGQNRHKVYHTYHYFDLESTPPYVSTPTYETVGPDFSEGWHTFGLSWEPNQLIWYVDGVERRRITSDEFVIPQQGMYLVANLATGGQWPGAVDPQLDSATFEIDYIHVYQRKADVLVLEDYQLVFNDEFGEPGDPLEVPGIDTEKWTTNYVWGPYVIINNEEQFYLDIGDTHSDLISDHSPFSTSDGVLSIKAIAAADTPLQTAPQLPEINDPVWTDYPSWQYDVTYTPPEYLSGVITSNDSFKFINGYAEIRAKVPEGDGLWPAFWLFNAYFVGPMPEIDVLEVRGEDTSKAVHSYHYHNSIGQLQSTSFTTPFDGAGKYSDGFHKYGVHWRAGKIDWYIDDEIVHSISGPQVSFQLMYLIANLAVGGDFSNIPIDPATVSSAFEIDYIRVYKHQDIH